MIPSEPIIVIARSDAILPITGNVNKVIPYTTLIFDGYNKDQTVFCEHFNYMLENHGVWLEYIKDEMDVAFANMDAVLTKFDNLSLIAGDGINILGTTVDTGLTVEIDDTVVTLDDNDQVIDGVKTFSSSPLTNEAQPLDANSLVRKDYVQNLVTKRDKHVVTSNTNVVSGLISGKVYTIFAYGVGAERGVGTASLYPSRFDTGTTTKFTNSATINWCDGNPPVFHMVIVTAEASGTVTVTLDDGGGKQGTVIKLVAVEI